VVAILTTCFEDYCLQQAACFLQWACLVYSLTQELQVVNSSETSLEFYQAAWRHIPEDSTLHNQHYGIHKSTCCNIRKLHSAHTVYLWVSNDSQNKQICCLNSIHQLVFVTETQFDFCEVGTKFLNVIYINFRHEVI
jgi:hypothetical protein